MMFGLGEEWLPYEFWPYTTVVLSRFFQLERDEDSLEVRSGLSNFEDSLLTKFNEAGILCSRDNKIAFGLKHKDTGQVIYIGFYDGRLSIGSRVRADAWLKPIKKVPGS